MTYTGKMFSSPLTRHLNGPWQNISLDAAESLDTKIISEVYKKYFSRHHDIALDLAQNAREFSIDLRERLTYLGIHTIDAFSKMDPMKMLESWKTYNAHHNHPKKLSSITLPEHQDCVVHGLNMLLTIQHDGWQPVHEYGNGKKKKRHLALAKFVGDNVIVIDPQNSTNPTQLAVNSFFIQSAEKFWEKYFSANIVEQKRVMPSHKLQYY